MGLYFLLRITFIVKHACRILLNSFFPPMQHGTGDLKALAIGFLHGIALYAFEHDLQAEQS
jgi:hypothetical protein